MLFVRLLTWLLERYHTLTLACLTGLMIGSLRKIWPWKSIVIDTGVPQAINVLPQAMDMEFFLASGLALLGVFAVAGLQWLAAREH